MRWFFAGIAVGVVGIIALLGVLGRPRKYRRVSYEALPALLRKLATCLRDRGRLYVTHRDTTGWIWIQKHERRASPSTLTFRYRNTDATKCHFDTVALAFEKAGVSVEMELTEVRKQPRALQVELDAGQAASFAGMANLCRLAFDAIGAKRDECLIVYAENPARPSDYPRGIREISPAVVL